MQVHVATFLASCMSGVALLCCLMVISNIYNDVQVIWRELDGEMDTFRTTTDDMWKDLMTISNAKVSRHARQAYKDGSGYETLPGAPAHEFVAMAPGGVAPTGAGCQCRGGAENKCRSGPPGPKGNPGVPGPNGIPGLDGRPGVDSQDVTPESQTISTCFYCAPGPPGSPGPMGRPGPRGMKGADGQQGKPGRDGNPGHPGEMGAGGSAGKVGPAGPTGEKGLDGRKPIGRPGPKGQRGAPGEQGPAGDNGKNGSQGPAGPAGPPGTQGPLGGPGPEGAPGPEGKMGRPGQDAEYCPCPPRKAGAAGGTYGDTGGRGDSYKSKH